MKKWTRNVEGQSEQEDLCLLIKKIKERQKKGVEIEQKRNFPSSNMQILEEVASVRVQVGAMGKPSNTPGM